MFNKTLKHYKRGTVPPTHPNSRWYASNRLFSHLTPERKIHASAKFKGRAEKKADLALKMALRGN